MKTISLLIIDDSIAIAKRVIALLEEARISCAISLATTVKEAKAFFTSQIPEIVLLDFNLPDGNGIDVIGFLKKQHPATKVIVFTNQAGAPYREICKKLGASSFLDKSNDFDRIPSVIASIEKF